MVFLLLDTKETKNRPISEPALHRFYHATGDADITYLCKSIISHWHPAWQGAIFVRKIKEGDINGKKKEVYQITEKDCSTALVINKPNDDEHGEPY